MKNKTKQLLAFLMSLTLLVSGLTLPAGAADTKDESVKAAEKPEVMSEKAVEKDEEALGGSRAPAEGELLTEMQEISGLERK